jgi:hypothetical protein
MSTLLSLGEILEPSTASITSPYVLSQSARIMLANGLATTSVSNPTLNAVYPADSATVATLLGAQYFIDRNARFPGGTGQYVVADISGNPHIFQTAIVSGGASPPSFTQLVYALADFAALCNAIAITGTGTLPSGTATIA